MSTKALDSFAKNDDAVLITVIVIGAIALYYFVLKPAIDGIGGGLSIAANAVNDAIDTTSTSIANAYTSATLPPTITPTGNAVLPDGSVVSISQISASNGGLTSGSFYWNGLQYMLTSNFDANGNRIAQNGLDMPSTSTWG